MLKPERVTFSADDDQFHQYPTTDQLDSFFDNSLVHYSTEFKKKIDQPDTSTVRHSNSLDELSSVPMSSQDQQQQQQPAEHEPPASEPPSSVSEQVPLLNDPNLHQLDALTLQQLALGANQTPSNTTEDNTERSPSHTTSLADIQKEIDRVKRMKYGRTYSSPTSSLYSRLTGNSFNGSNNNIDLSSLTHSVHFTDKETPNNRLPFSSTFITSIPESIVPASGASSTNDNHFIPIDLIESPSLEDREVFETFHTKQTTAPGVAIRQPENALNRHMSTSEADLLASLHRSASKQGLDTQSDHGTTYSGASDEMIFNEWDKERSLFQDYINSLRTEVRVLLQERADYQKQMETINSNLSEHKRLNVNQTHLDQKKFDLLQKSLEEKNLVLEQIQKEYETLKEKNNNLTRKVSNLRCDAKSQTGVIDELKQKIADLTVDFQNHVIVKRRLEASIVNLEGDCKILDAERIRLNNDMKETLAARQDLERVLQQANVQIAEQGSTIEMLRSDNIQIRSQLSATQRRMLQEKQQVMDYLRQIENDLVEKEQIKQREAILRKDYEKIQLIHQQDRQEIEQLNGQINQDRQKLNQLEEERLQLLKTMENFDDQQGKLQSQLDSYRTASKRLYTHFKIPFDSIQSIDQLIPMLEDRYRSEQVAQARVHQVPLVQSAPQVNNEQKIEELQRLREELGLKDIQLKQLDEANQAWQQYQQNQLNLLRDRLQITDSDNSSFEDIVQQLENRLSHLQDEIVTQQRINEQQKVVHQSRDTQTEDDNIQEILAAKAEIDGKQQDEIRQLQENLMTLTAQCARLDEANHAWQQYHQDEFDSFRDKLRKNLPVNSSQSLGDAADAIVAHLNQMKNEQDGLEQRLQTSDKLNEDLRSKAVNDDQALQATYSDAINALNAELQLIKRHNDQLETEKYILHQQLDKQSLMNINQERNTPTSDSITSDSKLFKKHTYSPQNNEVPIHSITPVQSASPLSNDQQQEFRQELARLTNQCAQLDQANQAWQTFQQTQLDNFKNALQSHFPIDQSASFEQAAQQIADQINKERNNFTQQYLVLEKINDQLQSESTEYIETIGQLNEELSTIKDRIQQVSMSGSRAGDEEEIRELREKLVSLTTQLDESNRALERTTNELRSESDENIQAMRESYNNTMNHLNQELLTMKETCEQLNTERQTLIGELQQRTTELSLEQARQSSQRATPNMLQNLFKEVPIHTSSSNTRQETEEVQQLRENVAALTAQCAQLDEANRAWQLYHQTQLNNFQNKLHDYVPIDGNTSLDDIADQIIDQVASEREDAREKYQALERENNDRQSEEDIEAVRQSYMNTVNELNQKLLTMKQAYDLIDNEKQVLVSELEQQAMDDDRNQIRRTTEKVTSDVRKQPFEEVPIHTNAPNVDRNAEEIRQLRESVTALTAQCAQLDEANHAWQLYQQKQADDFRNKLQDCLPLEDDASFVDMAQQIAYQMVQERKDFSEKYQALERANNELQSDQYLQSVRQPCVNIIDELNQELSTIKEAYDQLDQQNKILNDQLEQQALQIPPQTSTRTFERFSADSAKLSLAQVPIHTSAPNVHQDVEEIQQLRENVAALTAQCAQLDAANHAWQSYQQAQLDRLRNKISDYVPVEENMSLDDMTQELIDQLTQEREDFSDRFQTVERANDQLRSESTKAVETMNQSYTDTIDQLNQELLEMKEAYNQLDTERQNLLDELQKQSIAAEQDQMRRMTEKVALSNMRNEAFDEVPIHTSGRDTEEKKKEIQELQEKVAFLTAQCAQLDEANRAWQTYQQAQLDALRNKLNDHIPLEENSSLDEIGQQLVDQLTQEREDSNERFQAIERANDELEATKRSSMTTVDQLNQELVEMKDAYDQLETERQNLLDELQKQSIAVEQNQMRPITERVASSNMWNEGFDQVPIHTSGGDVEEKKREIQELQEQVVSLTAQCAQLDEANRAWRSYQETQLGGLKNKLIDYVSIEENASLDEIGQQLVNQLTQEREDFNDRFQAIERANNALRSEFTNALETAKQSSVNTIDQLNEELLEMKEAYNQLDTERGNLLDELQKQSIAAEQNQMRPITERVASSNMWDEGFDQVSVHSSGVDVEEKKKEMQDLQEKVAFLAAQCTQLNEANLAWQTYQQAQLDGLRNKLVDYVPIEETMSLDEIAQQVVNQLSQEREESSETPNDELQSESSNDPETTKQSYLNTIDQLNQQLVEMKEAYNQLDTERQHLFNELQKRSAEAEQDQIRRTTERVASSNLWEEGFDQVPIHTSGRDAEEKIASLTAQCAQLEEASRAWQSYHQTQVENLKNKLHDHLPVEGNDTLDDIAQEIIDHLARERNESRERYRELEDVTDNLRSGSATDLETMRQSHMDTVNELKEELLALKEAYEELDNEKQVLKNKLEGGSTNAELSPVNLSDEVPLQTSNTNAEQNNEELEQLREKLAQVSSQVAQLGETNRAWKESHQSQLNNFRNKLKECVEFDDDSSLNEMADRIADQITQEREAFVERYEFLEKANDGLHEESMNEKKNFLLLKEQYDGMLDERERLIAQIENQERDKETTDSTNVTVLEQQTEMAELHEQLRSLRTQFDEAQSSWEQLEHEQLNLLKTLLPFSTAESLEDMIQELISHVNHLTGEIETLKEREQNLDSIQQQIPAEKSNDDRILEELASLQTQCAQLDTANQAWQSFYNQQIQSLKNTFSNNLPSDEELNFDQIIQSLAEQLDSNETDQLKTRLNELQETNNLLIDTNQNLTYRLNQMERPSSPFISQENLKQTRRTPIQEVQIHQVTPVQSAPPATITEEELQQLRNNLSTLTAQCAQLDEANRAWEQYHQTQLENFRRQLQDWISFDENDNLEQIGQRIILQLDQLASSKEQSDLPTYTATIEALNKQIVNYQINESTVSQNIEQLNRDLLEVQDDCEDLRQDNAQLVSSIEEMKQQNDSLQGKLHELEQRPSLSAFQRVDPSREEIQQLRDELAAASAHCLQLEEANRAWHKYQSDQIESFRQNLQEKIPVVETDENPSLDSIAQQVINHLDQLNSQRDQLLQQNDSLKAEITMHTKELDGPDSEDDRTRLLDRVSQDRQFTEARIHDVAPVQSASPFSDDQQQELRQELARLTNQCAQLDQANQAWQTFQQTQLDNFKNALQSHFLIDQSASFEQAAQQIADQINKERNNFTQQYLALEKINDQLQSESTEYIETIDQLNEELSTIKDQTQQLNASADPRSSDALSKAFAEVPMGESRAGDEEEIRELREKLVSLTAQLDESNRAWEEYKEAQVAMLRDRLERSLSLDYERSLEEIAGQIVDQVTQEREDSNEKYQALERANNDLQSDARLESIRQPYVSTIDELNQELSTMKEAYDQLSQRTLQTAPEPLSSDPPAAAVTETSLHTSAPNVHQDVEEIQQLRANVAVLTAQCAQLDAANHAWQTYQQAQLDGLRNKLVDYLPIEESSSLDEIAQQVVNQLTARLQPTETTEGELQSESSNDPETTKQSYLNTIDQLNQQLVEMKEAHNQLDTERQHLFNELQRRSAEAEQDQIRRTTERVASSNLWEEGFDQVPIHTSGRDAEEKIASLTAQCAQLEEASRAWQSYHQTQVENLKNKLHDHIPVEGNDTLDDIAQSIIDQMTRDRNDFRERYGELEKVTDNLRTELTNTIPRTEQLSTETVDELTTELSNLRNQYEELEKINKELLSEREQLNGRLNELTAAAEEIELKASATPVESEEVRQMRSDLASVTSQLAELNQSNENDLNAFRDRLQNWVTLSSDSTLDDIAEQLNTHFEQQLPPETTTIETQTLDPPEKVHIGIETTRLILRDHPTQIDPMEMIDQQIQTESLLHIWSMSNDDNLFTSSDDDDRLRDYIDEIKSLTPLDLSHRLMDRCEQILSKQNFDRQSEPDLQPNHLALIALFSLYNQHLTDDAKQLYNDTVIRALRQEYELINDEKNDYMEKYLQVTESSDKKLNHLQNQYDELLEQDELGRFNSQKTIDDLKSAYEFQLLNLHQDNEQCKLNYKNLEEQYQQIKDKNYDELESEYQQLREDYNELINKNELLQDYNSQMYQNKLQGYNPNAHDIDIQCNLAEENQTSSGWDNDWEDDTTKTELAVQEQGVETISNEEEINRLKAMIEEIQIENQYLKELNSQYSNNPTAIDRPVCIENSVQTESEKILTEENDWNAQFSPLEMRTEEPTSSSIIKQTTDNETQTDEQSQEKLTQVNSKLQRALHTIKARIHQAANNRPDLFSDVGEDTIERLDHLISTIDGQTTQIDQLRNECQQARSEIDQLQNTLESSRSHDDNQTEPVLPAVLPSDDSSQSRHEDHEQQIKDLQQKLSRNEDERSLLRERLNEVELEYREAIDDRASTLAMYEEQLQSLVQERNALVEQQQTRSVDSSSLPDTTQMLAQQPFDAPSDEQFQSLKEEIEQKSEDLKDLTEKYIALLSQLDANANSQDTYKQETEERMADYQNQVEQLTHERANLLDEIQKNTASSSSTTEVEKQVLVDPQQEKQAKLNTKLKRALQSFKEKINRLVTDRPDLFNNVGEETSERLDHLISTVDHQATQMDNLQAERNEIEAQLQNEIRELQGSVEAYRYQIENERPVRSEQLVTSAEPPSSDTISQSIIEDSEKEIKQLKQKLSQNEDERSLLRERLNEVELEYREAIDDRASTLAMYEEQLQSLVQERNALVEQQEMQAADSQREMEQLKVELAHLKQTPSSSNEDVQSLQTVIQEQAEEVRDLNEKYFALASQIDAREEFDQQKRETDERIQQYESQIEHLIREHESLLHQVQNKSTPPLIADDETQTEDQQNDRMSQVNTKLKRALQNLKEKIHRLVSERPDLFADVGDDTNERLDQLVSLVRHQASHIENMQAEREQSEEQLRNEIQELQSSLVQTQHQLANEHSTNTEQLESTTAFPDNISQSAIDELEKEIKQLKQKLSQHEDERSLLRERLNEVELEFRQAIDDRASTIAMHEQHLQGLIQERNALAEQQQLQSDQSQHEIARLQQQLEEMRHVLDEQPTDESSTEEIQSLKEEVEQKSEDLKDLTEKYIALLPQRDANINLQALFDTYKQETEERMADYQNQVEQLTHERANLLDEIQKNTASSSSTTEVEKQVLVDPQQEKQAKLNTKLKRALQSFKEKINRLVTDRPDLFNNVGEETSERLDHLISTVDHQATQMDNLQAERNEIEAQLQNEIRELQGSVEAYRYEIENERPVRSEQFVTSAKPPSSDTISQSTHEDHEQQIKELRQKLSQNEDERSLLRERLNEVELEYREAIDDRASTLAMYEEQLQSLVQERNALVEQQEMQAADSQREIDRLEKELVKLKESSHDTESLNLLIEQQSDQLKHLNERYLAVSAQLESQAEVEREKGQEVQERLQHYENQIEYLTRERTSLLDELQKNATSSLPTTETERQVSADSQQDKLAKINTKLKRALQSFKEKINRLATAQPDLFNNIGEETSERLDHLISTVEHQAAQIEMLQTERHEIEAQLRNEMNELQNSFDQYRQQISDVNHHEALPSTATIVQQQQSETEFPQAGEDTAPLKTSNDGEWTDWTTDSSRPTVDNLHQSADDEAPSMANRLFGFLKNMASPRTEETPTNDWNDQSSPLQLRSEESQHTTFSPSSADHLLRLIENKIQEMIAEFPTLFPNPSENVVNNLDQLLSIIRNLENQIEELQNTSTVEEDRKPQEIQSASSTPADQRISRRVFEQELLAWSKESERLKDFVKQIQSENKKLKDIILKFEPIIQDYMRENERLKEDNQQLSFFTYPSTTDDSHSSDTDICYLTLKWLTYEVAQRTSDPNEQSLFRSDQNEVQLKQRLIDTERQMRSIRLYSEKLKKQFKHFQNEINAKNQELATLKAEIDKLRTSETQYRLEVDRLKVDLQCDQVKFQQLERELSDLKLERTNIDDANSTNNLRELLDLKERELNALKEKLDYTVRAHQLELQEAIKANQFSLDNVQRFEQLDQQNQEKRKQLEKRLGKICQIVRPLIDSQYLFRQESIIDLNALQQIITDTEAEERVISSLGPIRDCLGLLESQMKELQENLIENHVRRSKRSQERSESVPIPDENQWITSQRIPEYESIPINRDFFLATSSIDLIESDVRLCLDDILDDVIVRTTVK